MDPSCHVSLRFIPSFDFRRVPPDFCWSQFESESCQFFLFAYLAAIFLLKLQFVSHLFMISGRGAIQGTVV